MAYVQLKEEGNEDLSLSFKGIEEQNGEHPGIIDNTDLLDLKAT